MTMEVRAAYRLLSSDWFHAMSPEHQRQYLEEHPGSKYADQVKQGTDEAATPETPSTELKQMHPADAKKAHAILHHAKEALTSRFTKKLETMKSAKSALGALVKKEQLTPEHKEALTEVANTVVNTAIDFMPGGKIAKSFARVGFALAMGAIMSLRGNKDQAKDYGTAIVGNVLGILEGYARSHLASRAAQSIIEVESSEKEPEVKLEAKNRLVATEEKPLTPKQKQLDVNNNGKIDSEDLRKLREGEAKPVKAKPKMKPSKN